MRSEANLEQTNRNQIRTSLRFEKDQQNIDSFRGFIEEISLFSNRSEALIVIHNGSTQGHRIELEMIVTPIIPSHHRHPPCRVVSYTCVIIFHAVV